MESMTWQGYAIRSGCAIVAVISNQCIKHGSRAILDGDRRARTHACHQRSKVEKLSGNPVPAHNPGRRILRQVVVKIWLTTGVQLG